MRKTAFTLFEMILVVTILSVFLYLCSSLMITTLQTKKHLQGQYQEHRRVSAGWHVLYQDLGNALGVYYLDGTQWSPTPKNKKVKEKKKKTASRNLKRLTAKDLLFDFGAEESDAPFLTMVSAQGRLSSRSHEDLGFRLVKYYLRPHPDGEGDLIMRTEEPWQANTGDSEEDEDKELDLDTSDEFNLEDDYMRYTALEGLSDVELFVYNGEEWVEEWNSSEHGDLPLALRIDFMPIEGSEDLDEKMRRVIPIPISNATLKEPLEEL